MTRQSDTRTARLRYAPRRGLSRDEAALYVGVGVTKFDEMVKDGRMPHPKPIDGRVVWDIRALDHAWDKLPGSDTPGARVHFITTGGNPNNNAEDDEDDWKDVVA